MIIFYIMLVTIAGTDGKSRLTDRCPSSILQWKRQESLFSCPADAPYHCILKYNTSQLYEACIATVTIGPGVAGCPWILFHQGVPIHGSRNSECPISNPECPPANHNGYLSNQLYQYPACFMQRSARSSHGYDIITSELPRTVKDGTSNHTPEMEDANESQRNIYIALGLSVLVVVIVILSVAFCLFKRVCRSHEGSSKRNVNEEDESTDMINKGQLIPEKGNGTIQCTNEEEAVYSSNGNGAAECTNEKEKLISSNAAGGKNNGHVNQEPNKSSLDNTSTSNTKTLVQRSLQPTSGETAIGYNEPRQQRSKESSSVQNEDFDELTTDKEDTKEISQIKRKDDIEPDSTCFKEQTLNQHTITLYQRGDNDVVQRVFRGILEISDGVVSYSQLRMYFVQKEDGSEIQKNLENILKGNRNAFRLLEDASICFVIACMADVEICYDYNQSSGHCVNHCCSKFHICTSYVRSVCRKPHCSLSHTYGDEHNLKVKQRLGISKYKDSDINKILRNKYPKICSIPGCNADEDCPYLHICIKFCFRKCVHGLKCRFGHSFGTKHNVWILKAYDIPEDAIKSGSKLARSLTDGKKNNQTNS